MTTLTIKTTDPEQLTLEINHYMTSTSRKLLPPAIGAQLREIGLKRCPHCRRVQPRDNFSRKSSDSDGLESRCRPCNTARVIEHRNQDLDAARARGREATRRWRERNPLTDRLYKGRVRAEAAGRYAEHITPDELLQSWRDRGIDPEHSIYSGEPLTRENFSLDHLIPLSDPESPGHTASNIVPCLLSENETKSKRHWIWILNNEIPEDAPEPVRELLEVSA